jgi:hypothetical protein
MPRFGATTCVVLLAACETPAAPTDLEVPAKQFIFERLTLEERRGDRVLWTGTGRRADGDLSTAEVVDLELRCAGSRGPSERFVVHAPTAVLDFDAGSAVFNQVRIDDELGGVVSASRATYAESEGRIVAEGPIRFAARGLDARAPRAVILLDQEAIEIDGPVEGVYRRAPPTPPAPPAPLPP